MLVISQHFTPNVICFESGITSWTHDVMWRDGLCREILDQCNNHRHAIMNFMGLILGLGGEWVRFVSNMDKLRRRLKSTHLRLEEWPLARPLYTMAATCIGRSRV